MVSVYLFVYLEEKGGGRSAPVARGPLRTNGPLNVMDPPHLHHLLLLPDLPPLFGSKQLNQLFDLRLLPLLQRASGKCSRRLYLETD